MISQDYSIGIDPDSQTTALAVCSASAVHAVKIISLPKKLKLTGQRAQEAMVHAIAYQVPLWLRSLLDNCIVSYPSIVVAEGQQIYARGKTKKWDSILMLGPITGAAAAACMVGLPKLRIPLPNEWKGDIPKCVHQARVLHRRGFWYETRGTKKPGRDDRYSIPTKGHEGIHTDGEKLACTDWKHAVDAIGLADWGLALLESQASKEG